MDDEANLGAWLTVEVTLEDDEIRLGEVVKQVRSLSLEIPERPAGNCKAESED